MCGNDAKKHPVNDTVCYDLKSQLIDSVFHCGCTMRVSISCSLWVFLVVGLGLGLLSV